MSYPSTQPSCSESQPLLSLVTVCLNPGQELLTTGESVFQQQFDSFEWVIKDGLSQDGTETHSWPDPRVRRFARRDSGIFDAMNQALEYCRGQYVLFLNAGDVFCAPQVLARLAAEIPKHNWPEVLYTFYEYAQPGYVVKYPAQLRPGFLYRRSVCHQATLVRGDCFARYGGFQTTFRLGADDELLARLILQARVRHVLCPFPVVRVAEWNFSSRTEHRQDEVRAREYIRQQYLTAAERWRGRCFTAATLPALRKQWLSSPRNSWQHRFYVTLSNFFNQHA